MLLRKPSLPYMDSERTKGLFYDCRTAETPNLGPSHPVRVAFSRYGRYATHHVDLTLLVSVAVAAILIYPIPFLFTTDLSNGASNLPHHVWTVAQPLDYNNDVEPDVIMRSIWVHGSYMGALQKDVLLGALELQDHLLGTTTDFDPQQGTNTVDPKDEDTDLSLEERDTFHVLNGLTNQSWFFHSPLLYWSCSQENIESDPDIVATVNQRKNQATTVNVTLRHSIVFSGKRFEDRRLMTADALVITLVHLKDSPVARQWERKAAGLPLDIADKWTVYPSDGRSSSSQLYEFQFRPLSLQDSIILTFAYGMAIVFFHISLSKLRAVKSKFGLILAIVVQIVVSIMSSFTICAIFKLDLSRIPQAAYPLVVLLMSLENIIRLINAVILTDTEEKVSIRVGDAFGNTGHVALVSSTQNVLLLWAMSYLVSPSVSAFCIFVAVATAFDFFYLSTFFLSVLSIDVRRMELGDALAKASMRTSRPTGADQIRPSWSEAMLHGKIAVSTRVAGTIAAVCFVLIAQWHFLENETIWKVLARILLLPTNRPTRNAAKSLLVDVNQARSPTSWLRMQDHETAKDIIHVVNPHGHNYIARVFEPIVFVLKGADRVTRFKERPFLPAAYDFLHHQIIPFVVTVLFMLAAVRLFTNYLLWGESDEDLAGTHHDSELTIRTLPKGHTLDIVLLTPANHGILASVALDRGIRLWDANSTTNGSYSLTGMADSMVRSFPVHALAFDKDHQWLALLTSTHVVLWNLVARKWGPAVPIEVRGQKSEAFFFFTVEEPKTCSIFVVWRDGTVEQIDTENAASRETVLFKEPLLCASPLLSKGGSVNPNDMITRSSSPDVTRPTHHGVSIVCATNRHRIHVSTLDKTAWRTRSLELQDDCADDGGEVHQIIPLPVFRAFVAVRRQMAHIVSMSAFQVIQTFRTEPLIPRSMRVICSRCSTSQLPIPGMRSLTLAYTSSISGDCIIQVYHGAGECYSLSLDDLATHKANGDDVPTWLDATKSQKHIKNPGAWEALSGGHVVGIRKQLRGPLNAKCGVVPGAREGLRQRRSTDECRSRCETVWEVWMVSDIGKSDVLVTRPLFVEGEERAHLIVSEMGPLAKLGPNAMAVGFGTEIKIIATGQGYFSQDSDDADKNASLSVGSRRRKVHGSARHRVR